MNHVILVGRLTDNPSLVTSENTSRTVIDLAVHRTYKNQDGLYETDFIRCVLWNGIAKKVQTYCKKGDMVCVRGRLQVRSYMKDNEEKKYMTEVIVESLSFISNNKAGQEECLLEES